MLRLSQDLFPRRSGLSLIGLCLLACISSATHAADAYQMEMAAQSFGRHAVSGDQVLVCGEHSQQGAKLQIRGADVATLWRTAYHMLVPQTALAENEVSAPGARKLPKKGPTWGLNISRRSAQVTLQTKW